MNNFPTCAVCGKARGSPLPPYRDMTAWVCSDCAEGEGAAVRNKLTEAYWRLVETENIVDDRRYDGKLDVLLDAILSMRETYGEEP